MVLRKMFVAIILTKLQRFEGDGAQKCRRSRMKNVTRKLCGQGKILNGLRVKFNADFEYVVSFDHTRASEVRFGLEIFGPATYICSTFRAL